MSEYRRGRAGPSKSWNVAPGLGNGQLGLLWETAFSHGIKVPGAAMLTLITTIPQIPSPACDPRPQRNPSTPDRR